MKELLKHKDISFEKVENAIAVTNPYNLEVLAYVKKTSVSELEEIIKSSQIAQKNWREKTALQRADILYKWYELMKKHKESLAKIMTLEQGKSINEARGEVDYSASFIRWFAEEARRVDGDILTSVRNDQKLLVTKEPIGVTAAITPWNFPSAMISRKAAPALAAGCSMILKPASQTPLSAYALANLAYEAGVDENLFVVINGSASQISKCFCDSKIVKKISFTGSTEVGMLLYEQSAKTMKKLSLELGGNAPFIVFDDANLDKAVDGILASKFRNSGQTCVCANRIYVQEGIYDKFSQMIAKAVAKLEVGDGLKESTKQGPLIDEKAVLKVEEHIKDALNKGAKCLLGGKTHKLGGTFFEPTVLQDVTQDMLVAQEETFGPLCPIFKFQTDEEVVEFANNTDFGLASYIFTTSVSRQFKISQALEYGMVGVNTGAISNEVAPFGGVKFSGLGREGSKYGIDEYTQLKYTCLDIGE
ncbi:NAD-dependent succinate-semialdehyde dehydrogenase [Campylobacter geochelonis]|uniref:Succinate-semialdehyde dehydrogenase(NADP+) n=1 Tax=Campylobacter geochelonis TaxID=1780362 RepID=A0A128EI24_9BACT|nr:NAD-dependent succinate-semialdehyde dehydrogenase [Campylobacter geochelonis]QKF71510.1 succinate-semialdehyde dehydrogenase [Campylobacter geochelonis]CZE48456.1 succinate-semialdehyde dehydrogenase(NADP+) [Campylobacter geochelonis]